MIPLHTAYVVTLISQTTLALMLWLLAASDTRVRGLSYLAAACTLHTAAIALLPLWRTGNRWPAEALSAALLLLIFLLVHQGLRSLLQRERTPSPVLAAIAAAVAVVVAVAPLSQLWSMQIARLAATALMIWTIQILWSHSPAALRPAARATAVLLGVVALTFLLRIPLESNAPAPGILLALREVTMFVITLLAFSFLALYLAETKRRHHEETRRDILTGLFNRRAIEELAAQELHAASRSGQPLALLMMDLDSFKLLNDTWGHVVGDRALQAVGKILHLTAKHPGNLVARLGGEEFAVLLPACPLPDARKLAELLRSAVASIVVAEASRRITFTVSIGVTARHPGETSWTDMLHRADIALYRAKRAGRNRVVVCDTLEELAETPDRGTPHPRTSTPARQHGEAAVPVTAKQRSSA